MLSRKETSANDNVTITPPHQPNRPATRLATATNPTPSQLFTEAKFKDAKQAFTTLTKHGYAAPGDSITVTSLAASLRLVATCATQKVSQECVSAIAYLLDNEASSKAVSNYISSVIEEKLSQVASQFNSIADHLNSAVLDAANIPDKLTDVTARLEGRINSLATTTEECRDEIHQATSLVTEAASELQAHINELPTDPTSHAGTSAHLQPGSYAAAAARHTPAPPPRLARANLESRRVLVDKAPGAEGNAWTSLNERHIVEKGKLALELMMAESPPPDKIEVIGASKLANGGVLLELSSAEAAQYIRKERKAFCDAMGGTMVIKSREYATIAEYVPVSHNSDSAEELRLIEQRSELPENSITATRWIKPPGRRKEGQQSAHLIVRFNHPDAANVALTSGMVIACKRVQARVIDNEPKRCHKCQSFEGHIAANCKKEEVCATCGALDHTSRECTVSEHSEFFCINCNVKGHAAWSKECLAYLEETEKAKRRKGNQNRYWFFPSTEEWTWQTRDTPMRKQQRRGNEANKSGLPERYDWFEDSAREAAQKEARGIEQERRRTAGRPNRNANQIGGRDTGWPTQAPTPSAGPVVHEERQRGLSPYLTNNRTAPDTTQASTPSSQSLPTILE